MTESETTAFYNLDTLCTCRPVVGAAWKWSVGFAYGIHTFSTACIWHVAVRSKTIEASDLYALCCGNGSEFVKPAAMDSFWGVVMAGLTCSIASARTHMHAPPYLAKATDMARDMSGGTTLLRGSLHSILCCLSQARPSYVQTLTNSTLSHRHAHHAVYSLVLIRLHLSAFKSRPFHNLSRTQHTRARLPASLLSIEDNP